MEETETLGKYLKKQREEKKISLRELSKNTRVREAILKAIEEDRQDLLPSPTFVKGFLTAYARFIGLDVNDVLLRYQHVLKGAPEAPKDVKTADKVEGEKKRSGLLAGLIVVGAIVICLILVYFLFLQPKESPVAPPVSTPEQKEALPSATGPVPIEQTRPPEESPPSPVPSPPQPPGTVVPEKVAPAPAPSPPQSAVTVVPGKVAPAPAAAPAPPKPAPTNPPANPAQQGTAPNPAPALPQRPATDLPEKPQPLSLRLKAVETTWISMKVDDRGEKAMTLKPGDVIPVEAGKQIYVLIGNAGGLDLTFKGKPLERFGKTGEVVAVTLTSEGVEVKRFEKPTGQ